MLSGDESPAMIIDSHIHLYDPARFPFHPVSPFASQPYTLEEFKAFALEAKIARAVFVSPEPYQDDHRYLEHALHFEPSYGYFKGTCLFDAIDPATPGRMKQLDERNPGKIVAMRIHATRSPSMPPTTSGPIHDRDLAHPGVDACWKQAGQLGWAIQLHMHPGFAPVIDTLAARYPRVPVILDHFGYNGRLKQIGHPGPAAFDGLAALGRRSNVYLKVSSLQYASQQPAPHDDLKPLMRRAFDVWGPDRMLIGSLGHTKAAFDANIAIFEHQLSFASESDREKMRSGTAMRLYGFKP